jgi:hypothetical protein
MEVVEVKHLNIEAVQALLAAAHTDRNRLFLTVIYEHALRVSEAISLTRGSVLRGYLQIKGKKNGRRTDERMSPSTLELWDKVTACLLPDTLVFPFSRQWASEGIYHPAAAKAGIALQLRQGIHSLRHSCAHHLLEAGAPLPVVQRALRHKSIGSTGVYLEADGASVDVWRSKATQVIHHGTVAVPEPLSLAAIRMEIERLSNLALAMEPAPEPIAQAPAESNVKCDFATIYRVTGRDGTPLVRSDGEIPRHSDMLRHDLAFCDPEDVSKVLFPVFSGKAGRTSPHITRARWRSCGLHLERFDKAFVQPLAWVTYRHEGENPRRPLAPVSLAEWLAQHPGDRVAMWR